MTSAYDELFAKVDADIKEQEKKLSELKIVKERLSGLAGQKKLVEDTNEPIEMSHEINPEDLIEKRGEIKIDPSSVKQRREFNQDLTPEEARRMLDLEKLQATKPREQVFYSGPQPGAYQPQPPQPQYQPQPVYEQYQQPVQQVPDQLPPLPEAPEEYRQPQQYVQPMPVAQEPRRESGFVRTIKNPWFLIVLVVIILLAVAYFTKTITITA